MRNGNDPALTLDAFVELWQRLRVASTEPGTIVLVEGERDRRSVQRLGLAGPVVTVHRGRTLSETAQSLLHMARRVVILTDWDTEGGHLAHRLAEFLQPEHLELDLETRRRTGPRPSGRARPRRGALRLGPSIGRKRGGRDRRSARGRRRTGGPTRVLAVNGGHEG